MLEAEDTELNKKLSAFKKLIISWDKQTGKKIVYYRYACENTGKGQRM